MFLGIPVPMWILFGLLASGLGFAGITHFRRWRAAHPKILVLKDDEDNEDGKDKKKEKKEELTAEQIKLRELAKKAFKAGRWVFVASIFYYLSNGGYFWSVIMLALWIWYIVYQGWGKVEKWKEFGVWVFVAALWGGFIYWPTYWAIKATGHMDPTLEHGDTLSTIFSFHHRFKQVIKYNGRVVGWYYVRVASDGQYLHTAVQEHGCYETLHEMSDILGGSWPTMPLNPGDMDACKQLCAAGRELINGKQFSLCLANEKQKKEGACNQVELLKTVNPIYTARDGRYASVDNPSQSCDQGRY
jgi:hypothetical protein